MPEFRKLSDHPHSTKRLDDLLFHVDVFMPGGLIKLCQESYDAFKGKFKLSKKGREKIGCDASHNFNLDKVEKIANSINDIKPYVFEVATNFDQNNNQPYSIKKFVARIPYDNANDVSIVFFVKDIPLLLTAWLNPKSDTHKTLNRGLYVQSKKDRQERVAKMNKTINEIIQKATKKSIKEFIKKRL